MRSQGIVSEVCRVGSAIGAPFVMLADMHVPWIAPSAAVVTETCPGALPHAHSVWASDETTGTKGNVAVGSDVILGMVSTGPFPLDFAVKLTL